MYVFILLKHVVVLSKSDGPQMPPYNTDVHRVAHTIDVCILEQESHRQNKMIM
jgi:hypothetical protein